MKTDWQWEIKHHLDSHTHSFQGHTNFESLEKIQEFLFSESAQLKATLARARGSVMIKTWEGHVRKSDMLEKALLFLAFAFVLSISAGCTIAPSSGVSIVVYCVQDGATKANITVGCLATTKIESFTTPGPFCEMKIASRTFEIAFQPNVRSDKYGCATTLTFNDPGTQVVCA